MPEVVTRYDYVDEEGQLLYQVERLLPKGFRQRRPVEDGEWAYQLNGTRRVPYRLPELRAAVSKGVVISIVEGEKDVASLVERGRVATTFPGGAGKWKPEYAKYFLGAQVAIIIDNDDPGRKYGLTIANALDPIVKRLWVLQPAPQYKDITEHLEGGLSLKELRPFKDWEAPVEASSNGNGKVSIEVMTAKEVMALPTRAREGELLGPLLYEGDRLVLGAHTGHGKTSWTLQAVAAAVRGTQFLAWKGRGEVRALVIDVEQGVRTIQRRIREVGIHDSEAIFYLRIPDGLALDSDRDAIAKMEKVFKNGRYDVVLADPLYKLSRGDPNDSRAAVDLMRRFDDWRERFRFALILPMHCRKPHPNSKLSSHDLFGSSSYTWGAEVICGLDRKSTKADGTGGYSHLHWWKDREGDLAESGAVIGTHWGLQFDRENGFRRDPNDNSRVSSVDQIRVLLEQHPEGLRERDIIEELAYSPGTVSRARKALACVADDERFLVAERKWRLPGIQTTFELEGERE